MAQSREKIHSRDRNLLHVSHEGGELEDPGNAPLPTTWTWTKSPQDAPDAVEKVTIEFKHGLPIAVNGVSLDAVAIVEVLNEIGARTPSAASTWWRTASSASSPVAVMKRPAARCCWRLIASWKRCVWIVSCRIQTAYRAEVRRSRLLRTWFTPLRESLQAFVLSSQADVNGTVTLALYKGNVDVAGRKSETSLYRPDIASFTMGASYNQKDAEGFIRILGLPRAPGPLFTPRC